MSDSDIRPPRGPASACTLGYSAVSRPEPGEIATRGRPRAAPNASPDENGHLAEVRSHPARHAVNIQLVCVRSLVVTLGHLLWIGSSGYWLVAVWVDGMVR